jgi:hypothetical protein
MERPMTEQLKRYIFHAGEFRVHQDGDWIDFSDHAAAVAALEKRITALESYAAHLQWCRSCAEDPVGSCFDGTELQKDAGMEPTSHLPGEAR